MRRTRAAVNAMPSKVKWMIAGVVVQGLSAGFLAVVALGRSMVEDVYYGGAYARALHLPEVIMIAYALLAVALILGATGLLVGGGWVYVCVCGLEVIAVITGGLTLWTRDLTGLLAIGAALVMASLLSSRESRAWFSSTAG